MNPKRGMSRRHFLVLTTTTGVGAILAACAPVATPATAPGATAAPTTTSTEGGTLTYGSTHVGAIPTWLPWQRLSSAQLWHWNCTMSRLARVDKNGVPQPDLAAMWDVSPDGLTYTFNLRQGVTWHDGEPFTANDVAFTFHAALLPEAGSTMSALLPFKGAKDFQDKNTETAAGIQVLDDHTIQFTLDAPDAGLMSTLMSLEIAPAHPFAGIEDPAEWPKQSVATDRLIGTGPFRMTEWVSDDHAIVEAYDGYFRGRPKLDRIISKYFGDNNVQMIALDKGEIDLTNQSPSTAVDLAALQSVQNMVLDKYTGFYASAMHLSFKHEWWQDKRVRQAALYAIDRETICREVFGGTRQPATVAYWLVPWALSPNLNAYPYDPEKAKQLLADAGYDASQEHELIWFGAKMPDDLPIIQQQWEAVGIKTRLTQLEQARLMSVLYETSEYDIATGGGYGGWEPWVAITEIGCEAAYPAGWNTWHFCNDELDQILKNGPQELDTAKRGEMYQRGSEIINEELPYLPLYVGIGYWCWNTRVKGWEQEGAGVPHLSVGVWDTWNWSIEA